MFIKKGFGRLLRAVSGPSSFVWRVFLRPALSVIYRSVRSVRKLMVGFGLIGQGKHLGRYSMHIFVGLMAFFVMAANIQAMERKPDFSSVGDDSVMALLTQRELEDLVVEEFTPVELAKEVSYLETRGIRSRGFDVMPVVETNGGEVVAIDSGSVMPPASLVNAVRVQTEIASASSGSQSEESGSARRSEVVEHVVESGENIGSIARLYGLQTLTVLQANGLSSRSLIQPGQKLKIPPVDGLIYTVKSGDTLIKIASTYKSDISKIVQVNGLASAGSLSIGQKLVLPDGRVPPAPVRRTPTVITSNLKQVFTTPSPAASNTGTRLLWPTSARRITQYYNYSHRGVDIAAPVGTPLYAAEDGTVITSGWNSGGYGYMVLLDHGNGLYTRYGHASRLLVQKGDVVSRGDVIALMGSTGRSTGPHLHFEVLSGGIYSRVNPFDYIK